MSVAYQPLLKSRTIIWIGGPPGVGKTTLATRMQRYGFMALDCEDNWAKPKRLETLITVTQRAHDKGTSAFVFGACFSSFLPEAPQYVFPIVLLPDPGVYRERWQTRDKNDLQNHDGRYKEAVSASEQNRIISIRQHEAESIDATIFRICTDVSSTLPCSTE